jgi:hypothetical protein
MEERVHRKSRNTSARWAAAAVLALAGGAAGQAEATVVTYTSTCASSFFGDCSALGLAEGAMVSGSFTLATSAVTPNAVLTAADLLGFSMTFGAATLTYAAADAVRLEATLNGTANGFTDISFVASDLLAPDEGNGFYIRPTFWSATTTGGCDPGCSSLTLGVSGLLVSNGFTPGYGLASFSFAPDPTPAPEPASLALLVSALGGLAVARQRRRSGAA